MRYTNTVLFCYDVADQNSFDYIADNFDLIRQEMNSSRPIRSEEAEEKSKAAENHSCCTII